MYYRTFHIALHISIQNSGQGIGFPKPRTGERLKGGQIKGPTTPTHYHTLQHHHEGVPEQASLRQPMKLIAQLVHTTFHQVRTKVRTRSQEWHCTPPDEALGVSSALNCPESAHLAPISTALHLGSADSCRLNQGSMPISSHARTATTHRRTHAGRRERV